MATLTELRRIANSGIMTEAAGNGKDTLTKIKNGAEIAGAIAASLVVGTIGWMILVPVLVFGVTFRLILGPITDQHESVGTYYTDKEFAALLKQMTDLQKAFINKQRSSKFYKMVYQYHDAKIGEFGEVVNSKYRKVDLKSAFNQGMRIKPELCVLYFGVDGCDEDKRVYKNLLDEADKAESFHDYIGSIEGDICNEMEQHIKSLGFVTDKYNHGTSEKYPSLKISYTNDANGSWIIIEPATKLPIAKANSDTDKLRKISSK